MAVTPLYPDTGISYVFGPFRFTPGQRLLTRDRVVIRIGGKAFDLLHLLLINAGREVSKESLIQTVWPDTHVDEASLKVHVSSLRRALNDNLRSPEYIATIAGRGYQFIERVLLDRSEPLHPESVDQADGPCFMLPASTPLIGRESDLERISHALDQHALVTLVGAGGVGKTSLAVAAAHRLCERFSDGTHFVDLAAAANSSLVPQVITRSLGLRGDPPDVVLLLSRIFSEKRTLLVLDNCEHVLSYVAALSGALIANGICGALLATSREPLGNRAEQVLRLEPLMSPRERSVVSTVRAAMTYSATELFLLRARETLGYALGDADVPVVVQLCKLLDGLPLAIEIVAAQLEHFTPEQMLTSIKKHLPLSEGSARDRHPRQRTLRATMDWSYELLSPNEAALFCALSTFATHFGPGEVSSMGQLMCIDAHETTRALGTLVAKSLLVADADQDQLRYRLLTTTRTYAAARLEREAFVQGAHRQHARVILSSLERAETEWGSLDPAIWRARHAPRVADIRKALDWCFSGKGDITLGVSLAAASIRTWNEQSLICEQRFQVKRALLRSAKATSVPLQAAALSIAQAWSLTLARSFHGETAEAWQTALQFAEQSGVAQQVLSALFGQAVFLVYAGRHAEVLPAMAKARELARATDTSAIFDVERLDALARLHLGEITETQPILRRLSTELSAKAPSKAVRYHLQRYVGVRTTLAVSLWLSGEQDLGLSMAEQTVRMTAEHSQLMGLAHSLALAGLPLAYFHGQHDTLVRYAALLQDALSQETLAHWLPLNTFFGALVKGRTLDAEALREAQEAVVQLHVDGFLLRLPMYLGILAEGWLALEEPDPAGVLLRQARQISEQTKEHWYEPEILRIRARHAIALRDHHAWMRRLRTARAKARKAGTRSLELRASNDLAAALLTMGRHKEAVETYGDLLEQLQDKARNSPALQRAFHLMAVAQGGSAPALPPFTTMHNALRLG